MHNEIILASWGGLVLSEIALASKSGLVLSEIVLAGVAGYVSVSHTHFVNIPQGGHYLLTMEALADTLHHVCPVT